MLQPEQWIELKTKLENQLTTMLSLPEKSGRMEVRHASGLTTVADWCGPNVLHIDMKGFDNAEKKNT